MGAQVFDLSISFFLFFIMSSMQIRSLLAAGVMTVSAEIVIPPQESVEQIQNRRALLEADIYAKLVTRERHLSDCSKYTDSQSCADGRDLCSGTSDLPLLGDLAGDACWDALNECCGSACFGGDAVVTTPEGV